MEARKKWKGGFMGKHVNSQEVLSQDESGDNCFLFIEKVPSSKKDSFEISLIYEGDPVLVSFLLSETKKKFDKILEQFLLKKQRSID